MKMPGKFQIVDRADSTGQDGMLVFMWKGERCDRGVYNKRKRDALAAQTEQARERKREEFRRCTALGTTRP